MYQVLLFRGIFIFEFLKYRQPIYICFFKWISLDNFTPHCLHSISLKSGSGSFFFISDLSTAFTGSFSVQFHLFQNREFFHCIGVASKMAVHSSVVLSQYLSTNVTCNQLFIFLMHDHVWFHFEWLKLFLHKFDTQLFLYPQVLVLQSQNLNLHRTQLHFGILLFFLNLHPPLLHLPVFSMCFQQDLNRRF